MADSKISALTDGGGLQADDMLVIARSAASFKALGVGVDGWVSDTSEAWIYASGSGGGTATFTVTGDVTAKYAPGTRIKLTQTTVKYFVVISSSVSAGTTTVTITAGSDYTLANAAITANYHSYAAKPQGYPDWFTYSPSFSGWSSLTQNQGFFRVEGNRVDLVLRASGTSNSTSATAVAPATCSSAYVVGSSVTLAFINDNGGSTAFGRSVITAGATTITFGTNAGGSGFTASGTKAILLETWYRI